MGNQFFLGQRSGLLPRQEVAGQFPTLEEVRSNWLDGDTANIAFGQGRITVTPLQMGLMTAAIANGGRIFQPRLVARIEPADPDAFIEAMTFPKGKIRGQLRVNPHNLAAVQHAMWADVHEEGGTGRRAKIEGYAVCGKTGTAEVRSSGRRDKITWFASYAPYERPRYAVVAMLESGISGGRTAPVAKIIFEALRDRDIELSRRPNGALANN
jgi:penicillin-binding protein 2